MLDKFDLMYQVCWDTQSSHSYSDSSENIPYNSWVFHKDVLDCSHSLPPDEGHHNTKVQGDAMESNTRCGMESQGTGPEVAEIKSCYFAV